MSIHFQEILAWRFVGAACWAATMLFLSEIIIAIAVSSLYLPGAFDMLGIRGLLLLGLQFIVQVGGAMQPHVCHCTRAKLRS
jgi:hypothetical protein